MRHSQKIGLQGENAASKFLVKQGYEIVIRNYHSRFGEVDIIAQNEKNIIFVEVKTREKNTKFSAKEAVDVQKQKRIAKTALLYLSEHHVNLQPRFDVIEVLVEKKSDLFIKINHIENAFYGVDFYEAF